MDDLDGISESLQRKKDESFSAYSSCMQHFSRLHTELEEANRKAYNMVESAESLQRTADMEVDMALRMLSDAEEESEISAAQDRLSYAQAMQVQAAQEMAVASAAYEKARSNMQKLTAILDRHQPSLNTSVKQIETGASSFITLANNGNRDLKNYMSMLDKAQSALYDENGGAVSSSSSATSSSSGTNATSPTSSLSSSANDPSSASSLSGSANMPSSASSLSGSANMPSSASSISNGTTAPSSTSLSSNSFSGAPNGVTNTSSSSDQSKNDCVAYAFKSAGGNTLTVSSGKGNASIAMTIGDKSYSYPGTKSGAAKAHREALKSDDSEMIAQTEAMFKAPSPTAYNDVFTSQYTKHITVPYHTVSESGKKEYHSYDLPIVCNCGFSELPQTKNDFGTDADTAAEWAHENYKQWRSELTAETESAIRSYAHLNHKKINDANRGNIPKEGWIQDLSDDIDAGLNAATLPEEITVYRGISENAIVDMALKGGGKLESGIILEDRGFLSTSLISDTKFTRDSKYIMRLVAGPGLHCAPLEHGDLANVPKENEMLFGRNHCIYIRNVTETKRSNLCHGLNDDSVVVIDGILTI